MKKGYKKLTQDDFDTVKLLQKLNVKQSEAIKITGRSSGTVSTIYRSETMEDYYVNISKEKRAKPVEEPKTDVLAEINSKLDKLIELAEQKKGLFW